MRPVAQGGEDYFNGEQDGTRSLESDFKRFQLRHGQPDRLSIWRNSSQNTIRNWQSSACNPYDACTEKSEASKEGGFLGFGGQLVSEEEAAAVEELANALGMSAKA